MHIPEGFSGFVTSTAAPVASGGSTSPGGTFTHWNNTAFSRRTSKAEIGASRKRTFNAPILYAWGVPHRNFAIDAI
jgi:hypothetical protein